MPLGIKRRRIQSPRGVFSSTRQTEKKTYPIRKKPNVVMALFNTSISVLITSRMTYSYYWTAHQEAKRTVNWVTQENV